MKTKIIAWNVNGLRAVLKKKNLHEILKEDPDIFCMGETKLSCPYHEIIEEMNNLFPEYKYKYWNTCLRRNGYSGTAIWSKKKPLSVSEGLGHEEHDQEGRVITLEFKNYYLVHVYTPNSGMGLVRLDYRIKEWDIKFREHIKKLSKDKGVIVCGDLNTANEDIDIHNPKGNKKSAGFTNEERDSFKKLLEEAKLIDTFRHLYPTEIKYSYWNYKFQAKEKNRGWRIDYFLVSKKLLPKVVDSDILTDQKGSDHAPVVLILK